jgi:hypothetical protein
MLSSLGVILVLLAFGAPWTFLLWHRYRRSGEATLEAFLDHVCIGYAISFVVLFVAGQFRLWLFVPIWIAGALAALAALALGLRRSERQQSRMLIGVDGYILLGAAALYTVLRALPFVVRTFPIGWDAYFHMNISESILERGRAVHDWLPYEDMPLNYPIGSHLLMALIQWLTGQRPHLFFDVMVVLFTLLSGLQLFSLMTRATNDRRVGLYSALAYLFLGNLGSLHYVMWSGLPNLIGMYVFLGLLTALVADEPSLVRSSAVFAIYFLAACFVHHHVMVTAGLCLAWTAVVLFLIGDRARAKRIAVGFVVSGVLGIPYFLMYVMRFVTLSNTKIGSYMERAADAWGLAQSIGLGYSAVVAVGLYLYFKNSERVSQIVVQSLVAMLMLYVFVEFIVRTLSLTLFEHEISPFTPSRWITDAVVLMSVFAGIFFRTLQGESERARLPIVAMILAGFIVFNRATYRDSFRQAVPKEKAEVYEWIRLNTAPNAALLEQDWHASYLTHRMSSGFPLPTSEYSALASNRILLKKVATGKAGPEVVNRQVVAIGEPRRKPPAGKVLWKSPAGYRVVERFAPPQ